MLFTKLHKNCEEKGKSGRQNYTFFFKKDLLHSVSTVFEWKCAARVTFVSFMHIWGRDPSKQKGLTSRRLRFNVSKAVGCEHGIQKNHPTLSGMQKRCSWEKFVSRGQRG